MPTTEYRISNIDQLRQLVNKEQLTQLQVKDIFQAWHNVILLNDYKNPIEIVDFMECYLAKYKSNAEVPLFPDIDLDCKR